MGDPNSRTCTFVSSHLARGYKPSENGELKNGERFSNRPMVHLLKESHVNNSAKANSVFCSVYDSLLTIQRRQTRSSVVLSVVLIWSTISGEFY